MVCAALLATRERKLTYSGVSRVRMVRIGLRFIPPMQELLHMKLSRIVVISEPNWNRKSINIKMYCWLTQLQLKGNMIHIQEKKKHLFCAVLSKVKKERLHFLYYKSTTYYISSYRKIIKMKSLFWMIDYYMLSVWNSTEEMHTCIKVNAFNLCVNRTPSLNCVGVCSCGEEKCLELLQHFIHPLTNLMRPMEETWMGTNQSCVEKRRCAPQSEHSWAVIPVEAHMVQSHSVSLCVDLQNTEPSDCPPLWSDGCDAPQLNRLQIKTNWNSQGCTNS